MNFKEGDTVRILADCGRIKKGEIHTVINDKFGLGVAKFDENGRRIGFCSCRHTWEKILGKNLMEFMGV